MIYPWSNPSTRFGGDRRRNWFSRVLPVLLLPLLLLGLSSALAQKPAKGKKGKTTTWRRPVKVPGFGKPHCKGCKDQGWKWCKKHKKSIRLLEDGVPQSSVAAYCKICQGTLRVDCKACKNVAAEAWLAKDLARRKAWHADKVQYDKLVRHELLHLASPHFELIFDIPKFKVGRRVMKRHPLAHLYLDRLEAHYEHFKQVLCCYDSDFKPPFRICIWNHAVDQAKVGPRLTGMGSRGGHGSKLMGAKCAFTVTRGDGANNDRDLHRCVVHNTTHLLLSNISPHQWIGKRKAGWLDAGVAHYFEFLLDGKCTNYCFTEQNTRINFQGGKWRAWLRMKVVTGWKLPRFVSYYTKLIDELTPLEHALSFSNVEFMITKFGGERLKRLVVGIMEKRPQREVVKEVYGFSILEFENKWRAHVLATYPTRE